MKKILIVFLLLFFVLLSFGSTFKYDSKIKINNEYVEVVQETLIGDLIKRILKPITDLVNALYFIGIDITPMLPGISKIVDILPKTPQQDEPKTSTLTEQVKKGLTNKGYTWYPEDTCEKRGINDLSACYAYSQFGYKKSQGGKPAEKGGYAYNDGWCNAFVMWAKEMAGVGYDSTSGSNYSPNINYKDGTVVYKKNTHYAIIFKDKNGTWWKIDGNWDQSTDPKVVLNEIENNSGEKGLGSAINLTSSTEYVEVKYIQ